jgi:multiple antibiotic resistance protein
MLELGQIFTLFFVTLGPLKLLGPYAQETRELSEPALRAVAFRVFGFGLAAIFIGGSAGTALAAEWNISIPAILIATGIIFFLVAINLVMAPYDSGRLASAALPVAPTAAALRLTFPQVVSPYGIAALIAVLAATADPSRKLHIYLILIAMMAVNLLAMLYIRQILRPPVLLLLQLFGAVLGVLQVCLAVQIVIRALHQLHVLA